MFNDSAITSRIVSDSGQIVFRCVPCGLDGMCYMVGFFSSGRVVSKVMYPNEEE